MCIWVAQQNQESVFQFFLFIKMLYPNGKTKFIPAEACALAQMMNYADVRSIQMQIVRLLELGWIYKNEKTEYYIIRSFDKLRLINEWESRVSLKCGLDDLNKIQAFIGAAIFAYLHKDFWRKVKREKSVRLKGRAYHFLSPSFNFKKHSAPIATTGVEAICNISKSKASYLKTMARKANYITIQKDFDKTEFSEAEIKAQIKYCNLPNRILKKDGKFALQLIDLILPKIDLKKRKTLEHKERDI